MQVVQELSKHFMKLGGSLPYSKEPSSGPNPERDKPSYTTISYLRFILIYSINIRLGLPSAFLMVFPPISYIYMCVYMYIYTQTKTT
jgi:hypothetical protein